MGIIFSTIFDSLFGPYRYKISMVGLDNAGKTTILYQLSLGDVVATQPTVGANVDTVKYNNIEFQVWDLGGQESLRQIWASYYVDTNAIILVVDSSDHVRLPLVKYELNKILSMDAVKDAVILVYANKQDVEQALTPSDIITALGVTEIKRPFHLQACCALTGEGLMDGLEWIASQLKH